MLRSFVLPRGSRLLCARRVAIRAASSLKLKRRRKDAVVELPEYMRARELSRRTGADLKSVLKALCVKENGKYYMRDESGAEYEFPNSRSVVVSRAQAAALCAREGLAWEPVSALPQPARAEGWAAPGAAGGGRRAVVAVMGHVDHGKTTLCDALVGGDTAGAEAGGITQRVHHHELEVDPALPPVTLLDTPGHWHFFRMREDSAGAADAALLLVAADEGFMPQTEECVHCLADAGVPVLAALTKADVPPAERVLDAARMREELEARGLRPAAVVEVSAPAGRGMPAVRAFLRDAVAARVAAPPPGAPCEALVLDARSERGRGLELAVLVRGAALRAGDAFVVDDLLGRVRSLRSAAGAELAAAEPGQLALVAGARRAGAGRTLPPVGETLFVLPLERCRAAVEHREMLLSMADHCLGGEPPLERARREEEEAWATAQARRAEEVAPRVAAVRLRHGGAPASAEAARSGAGGRAGGGEGVGAGEEEYEYVEVDTEEEEEEEEQQQRGAGAEQSGAGPGAGAAGAGATRAARERAIRGTAAHAVLEGGGGGALARAAAALKTPELLGEDRLPVVVKTDSAAALGTICDILEEGAPVKLVSVGVGDVTKHDIETAAAVRCPIFCFNLRPSRRALREARAEGVQVTNHSVLHEMVGQLEAWSAEVYARKKR